MKRKPNHQTQGTKQMTFNTTVNTFVVACAGRGNWIVEDNNGVGRCGFKNWVEAEAHARARALAESVEDNKIAVVRLSAKTGGVVFHGFPQSEVPAALKRKNAPKVPPTDAVGVPTIVADPTPTAEELNALPTPTAEEPNALPTPALVAAYNAVGGNITSKIPEFKICAELVEKILNAANA